jgi:protein gp37
MAAETGIGWTTSTVNFWIGCTPVGPGCEGCYAFAWAYQKWGIVFEPGGERRPTKVGFADPMRWQHAHERAAAGIPFRHIKHDVVNPHRHHWVFCNSLSDFFDKEAPAELRARAWAVIKACNHLRWQIVTKRPGNIERYLPEDWDGGKGYEHVGIIGTVVDQPEYDRDAGKLVTAKTALGVKWIGLSIEPQLGHIQLTQWPMFLDWIITGGESRQTAWERNEQGVLVKRPHEPRPYHTEWAASLIEQCDDYNIPLYVKQMGDAGFDREQPMKLSPMGKKPAEWPDHIRVQQMPRIYDNEPARTLL